MPRATGPLNKPQSQASAAAPSYESLQPTPLEDPIEKSLSSTSTNSSNSQTGETDLSHLPAAVRAMQSNREMRWSRPFRLAVDVPRGCLQALQTLMHYLLM